MKDSQLYKSVLENLHNPMLKNVRDIDIQKESFASSISRVLNRIKKLYLQ